MLPETFRQYTRYSEDCVGEVLYSEDGHISFDPLLVCVRNARRQRARCVWTNLLPNPNRAEPMTAEACYELARKCRDARAMHQASYWEESGRAIGLGLLVLRWTDPIFWKKETCRR
jgi:hypothetical protein